MEPEAQGGATAYYYARFLAFFTLCCIALTGCGPTQEPPPAPRRYVRLDTLLTLHPAWSQVTALDQAEAQLSTAQQQTTALRYETSPLPPLLTPPDTLPTNLAKQREDRIK